MIKEIIKHIQNDLLENNGCDLQYFNSKLFDTDSYTYARRTFNDLYTYFKHDYPKLTEEQIMGCLVESGCRSYICHDIKNLVFFKISSKYKFTHFNKSDFLEFKEKEKTLILDTKYNLTYLENLYDKVYPKE